MSKTVTLDARKVVKYINEGAQSNVALFENLVYRLGQQSGRKYRLVSLHNDNLMFEDVGSGGYYFAKHDRTKKNGKVHLTDIAKVSVCESKKGHVFSNACCELVTAIEEGKAKEAEVAFDKLAMCRFRPTVTASDGCVVTRDGVRRFIGVNNATVSESNKDRVIEAILEAVSDRVEVKDGNIIKASLGDGTDLPIPFTEMDRRRMIAKKMKAVAESAHASPSFQKFVRQVAGLISQDKLKEAVTESAKFLREYQEFCMLNAEEMKTLVEGALATQNIMNPVLVDHTALTLYRSNLRVNRNDIVNAWSKTAKLASNSQLMESIESLKSSKSFENDYAKFLADVMTEDKETQRKAFLNSLSVIKKTLAGEVGIQDEAVTQVDELIGRLSSGDAADDAALSEAADLLASLDSSIIDMGNFDTSMAPSIEPAEMAAAATATAAEKEPAMAAPTPEAGAAAGGAAPAGGPSAAGLEPELGELETGAKGEEPEAEEGEEKAGEGEKKEEGEEEGEEGTLDLSFGDEEEGEEEELLAASKVVPVEEMGLEVLQEEFKTWKQDINVFLAEHGSEKVTKDLTRYAERCAALKQESLAEQFKSLIPVIEEDTTDPYATFVTPEQIAEVAKEYGAVDEAKGDFGGKKAPPFGSKEREKMKGKKDKKGEKDEKCEDKDAEGEVVDEAQRKSPTVAKKRGRPQMTKKSLMKETEGGETEEAVSEEQQEIEEAVAVAVSDEDNLASAIDAIFDNLGGEAAIPVVTPEATPPPPPPAEEPAAEEPAVEAGEVEGEEGGEGEEEVAEEKTPEEAVVEDNDVTDPSKGTYKNDQAPRKWGDGSKKDDKPKVQNMKTPSAVPVKVPAKSTKPKFSAGPFKKI